ncbi:YidH family protein [Jeotgalibacillus salarius]|uniref:DUF202 domain-containing protein n=1 Tax=Jeotgalibacillus salarius TaxID=546023 RepID=A0A4Y8LH67_9BACL|nr:DUF202 domain-containing protein [Jeotgalibacillus salarius]TFE02160.1 DUF202 domain-containing protein [Jeotgalibacillus salarius]
MNKNSDIEKTLIQQHLANERTMLAWIRTAIALIGIGFLVTNLHYTIGTSGTYNTDSFINFIGFFSVFLGILTIVLSMISYFKNAKSINDQSFHSSRYTVILLGVFVLIVAVLFAIYFVISI